MSSPHDLLWVGDDVFCDKRPRHGSLSVSVDLTNPKEVEILKEVLLMWSTEAMKELEIFFKVRTIQFICHALNFINYFSLGHSYVHLYILHVFLFLVRNQCSSRRR